MGMTTRLQVLMDEEELQEIRRAAEAQRQSVSEWVRATLRAARARKPLSVEEKLRILHEASLLNGPTCDIEQMKAEIADGYMKKWPDDLR